MNALLALVPWYWRWLALVGAFLACFGYGWVEGAHHEEGELDDFRASVDKAYSEQVVRQAERKRLSDVYIKGKDERHAAEIQEVRDYWARHTERMRLPGAGPGAQPVRIDAAVCEDSPGNKRLSNALADFESSLVGAVERYQEGIAGLLAACEVQTKDLIDLQQWVSFEQMLNSQPKKETP